ncbi:SDR family NAD(P)-dependent oxidoreductase [Spirillospora sp. NPDC048911]|uniref:SDR family NAD(P)-dependent oxidoreductase n=1 Tax=Spirillospora sp. NPDC048911 TaxID=3364527 RepID=UPI003715E49F
MTSIVIVGGTSGIGRELARHYAAEGADVVITGRDASRAATAAKEIDGAGSAAFDLTRPDEIAPALAGVEHVDHLVLTAIDRDHNTAAGYRLDGARRLATLKLVGYTEVVHALLPRMGHDASIVIFGGLAKDRPYPGSTTVSTVNGAVMGLVHTLAVELAPIRVNAIHPGIVGDSPFWRDKPLEAVISRTPLGRLATMADVVDAVAFLLRNRSVNGVNLNIDGGWLLT